jgi:hypothetical protein
MIWLLFIIDNYILLIHGLHQQKVEFNVLYLSYQPKRLAGFCRPLLRVYACKILDEHTSG